MFINIGKKIKEAPIIPLFVDKSFANYAVGKVPTKPDKAYGAYYRNLDLEVVDRDLIKKRSSNIAASIILEKQGETFQQRK